MTNNSWLSPSGADLSAGYARHSRTLRGAIRHGLVARALFTHLPTEPQRILDIGGGDGHQAVQLARAGHHVTLLDADTTMLQLAQERLKGEPEQVRANVVLVHGRGEHAGDLVGGGFDAACCHGVLMYCDDPTSLLTQLVAAVRAGGRISVLAKNATALAMRPALEGRWADALEMMDTTTEVGNLGVSSRADTIPGVRRLLVDLGATTTKWYGVRVFTDHLGDTPVGEDFDQILEAEWRAGLCEPYRRVARLFHIIAQANR
ncbi:methyltransferase domain-containing protein [Streptosporangium canum]|uniref:methyltransferase domain-containing protein n=1 Tax=Streptosporangium canum TaxID=324952 RepID=UPI0036BB5166